MMTFKKSLFFSSLPSGGTWNPLLAPTALKENFDALVYWTPLSIGHLVSEQLFFGYKGVQCATKGGVRRGTRTSAYPRRTHSTPHRLIAGAGTYLETDGVSQPQENCWQYRGGRSLKLSRRSMDFKRSQTTMRHT